jgi:hypothetical protein
MARPRVLERREWVWCDWVESAGNCERELGVVVGCGWPLDKADFAGCDAGIFGAEVVRWRPEGRLLETYDIISKKNY